MLKSLIITLMLIASLGCEELQGPYLLNLNTYSVKVGFDHRDKKNLKIIESRKAITNIGINHKYLYFERPSIPADPLEFNFKAIKTQNLKMHIIVLKGQALYIVPAKNGDALETGDVEKLAIERVSPLH